MTSGHRVWENIFLWFCFSLGRRTQVVLLVSRERDDEFEYDDDDKNGQEELEKDDDDKKYKYRIMMIKKHWIM